MTRSLPLILTTLVLCSLSPAAEFKFKERLTGELASQVPDILKTYDAKTGRFGSGIWICTDQNVMLPLAVAYSHGAPGN